MNNVEEIKRLLALCGPAEREQVFRYLRPDFSLHVLEEELNAKAEIILEAIRRAGGLTVRMMRGVIAEAAFGVEVIEQSKLWQSTELSGDPAYDFLLSDSVGNVRVQVKLQRSKDGRPWLANQGPRLFRALPAEMYVVETQKTRGGTKKATGSPTRPYRFSEFDVLAVAMYPVTKKWDSFMYTVSDWLLPSLLDPSVIHKYQPVPITPNEDWTNNFETAVSWLRAGTKKRIRSQ